MYSFKRLMVALDFTLMDKSLIAYTAFLCKHLDVHKIYFINVQRDLDIPEEIRKKFPELNKPLDEKLVADMKESVKTNFPDIEKYDVEYIVNEGSPFEVLIKWAHIKSVDLIILGRKNELKGEGVLSLRLARKALASALFVPENPHFSLKEIFVPIDFSDNSLLALQEAVTLAENDPEASIFCHHVYSLPSGYYVTGKSEEEFSDLMKKHLIEKYNAMLEDIDFSNSHIRPKFELQRNGSASAENIYKAANKNKADVLVIGARGRTPLAALFLGSVTEKVLSIVNDIPVLVVKNKDHSFNIMDFIKTV